MTRKIKQMTTQNIKPMIPYYGGKHKLRNRILPYVPQGTLYCEPFAGAASLLLARQLSKIEVLNDLDGEIVNLYRVLQVPRTAKQLQRRLEQTPYSFAEFCRALDQQQGTKVDRAWAMVVLASQGFSGQSKSKGYWSRSKSRTNKAVSWSNRPARIEPLTERLRHVQLDQRDAAESIRSWDSPEAVFYVDPPYAHHTRFAGVNYRCELTDTDHAQLVDTLLEVSGSVTLSGYDTPLYEQLISHDWHLVKIPTTSSSSGTKRTPRTECLWLNPHCQHLLAEETVTLTASAA